MIRVDVGNSFGNQRGTCIRGVRAGIEPTTRGFSILAQPCAQVLVFSNFSYINQGVTSNKGYRVLPCLTPVFAAFRYLYATWEERDETKANEEIGGESRPDPK